MRKVIYLLIFCASLFSEKITAQCQASFNYGSSNLTVQFIDSSSTPPSTPIIYSWSFGDNNFSSLQNPTHTYSQPGTYYVCLTIYDTLNTCFDSACFNVTVMNSIPPCSANFTASSNGLNVFFQNNSVVSGAASYSWNFGDGAISNQTNPFHAYATGGLYAVTLSVFDSLTNCSSQFIDSINLVAPPPCTAGFSYTTNNDSLFIQSTAVNYITVDYDFGDGSTSSQLNPTHIYAQSGTYVVCQTVTDTTHGCSDTFCDTISITIAPPCAAGFNYTTNNDSLFIQSTAANFSVLQYDFGDGTTSNQLNPVHTYSQSGTYVVCQTVSNLNTSCTDTFCDTITITIPPPCAAGFTFSVNVQNVSIVNTASNFNSVFYDFGDGTTSSQLNPMHQYAQSGTYTICQTVTNMNGCSATFCDSVTINIPPCIANFSYTTNLGTIDIQNKAQNFTTIQYDFGDGGTSSQTNPSYTYSKSGTYIVCQTVSNSNNCTSNFCDTVLIRIPDPCVAGFTDSTENDTTYFTTTAQSFNRVLYLFGDGNSSTDINPIHSYQNSGVFEVKQFVFNDTINCVDSTSRMITVTISSSCVAKYELALDTNQTGTLFLVNTSSSDNTHSYFWDFGDGTTSTERLPTHQFATNDAFKICLTVSDVTQNCTSTYCDSVGLDSNGNILKTNGFIVKVINGTFIGIDEISVFEELKMYPNPVNHQLTIELESDGEVVEYQLLNSEGSVIEIGKLKNGKSQVEFSHLSKGFYFLKLANSKELVVKRIIKY